MEFAWRAQHRTQAAGFSGDPPEQKQADRQHERRTDAFQNLDGFDAAPDHGDVQGALASLGRRPLPDVHAVIASARRIVVLEDLVDHGNVGAIFRCAAALGVDAVVLSPRCADPLYQRAVKVSMGAVFAVPYARMTDWYGGLAQL